MGKYKDNEQLIGILIAIIAVIGSYILYKNGILQRLLAYVGLDINSLINSLGLSGIGGGIGLDSATTPETTITETIETEEGNEEEEEKNGKDEEEDGD